MRYSNSYILSISINFESSAVMSILIHEVEYSSEHILRDLISSAGQNVQHCCNFVRNFVSFFLIRYFGSELTLKMIKMSFSVPLAHLILGYIKVHAFF